MKALYLLILSFFLISFVSLSSSNDTKHSRDIDDQDTSEQARKLQKLTSAPCSMCKKETQEPTICTRCGHSHHTTCIYKIFASTDPTIWGKCSECQNDFKYEGFLRTTMAMTNLPDGIFFIRDIVDQETIAILAKSAIKLKNSLFIRNLLKLKVPFNEFPIHKGYSALFLAAALGSPEILDILLKCGLEFAPTSDSDLNILLICAVNVGNVENVRYLLDQGADINFIYEKISRAAIHEAVYVKKPEVVKVLIEKGANINLKSAKHGYPLHMAIENNSDTILGLLLKAGVNVDVANRLNRPPMASACYLNKLGAVKLLLEHGCSINFFSAEGYNLLHYAIIPGSFEVAEYLISINSNIQMQNGTPSYVLHRSTLEERTKMVKYLLEIGADPYEKFDHETFRLVGNHHRDLVGIITLDDPAIVLAIIKNNKELVEVFLNAGVNPSTRIFRSTSTLLHFAIQRSFYGIAELLIERGADINALDSVGHKPLSYATEEWVSFLTVSHSKSL